MPKTSAKAKPNRAYSFDSVKKRKPMGFVSMPLNSNPGANAYALWCDGDCLEPEIRHGESVVCDPDQKLIPGDLIAIWWKDGTRQPLIKRLTIGLPEKRYWGATGDGEFLLICEQINPLRSYAFPLAIVQDVHKVIFHIPTDG